MRLPLSLAPVVAAVLAATLLPGAAARADACATVKAAYDRLATVPAVAQTLVTPGAPTMQMVTLGDTLYLDKGDGAWTTIPLSPGMRAQMMASAIPSSDALTACTEQAAETLDGAPMTVFEYTPPSMDGQPSPPQTVWIDADGLPRRMTTQLDDGPLEMTLVYEGVTAPK